jgi:hypothetical protein
MYPSYEEIRGEMQFRGLEGLMSDVYLCDATTSIGESGLCALVHHITRAVARFGRVLR